jgi:hypothetical protein
MTLKWTIFSSVVLFVLIIATFVGFEVMIQPHSLQRQQFVNGVWAFGGLLFVALWASYVFTRRKQGKKSKEGKKGKRK